MAWDDDMPTILRGLVQDWDATPAYSDDQLVQTILIHALGIQLEVAFATPFAVSISNQTIRPDPTATATKDDNFVNLVCLRSALGLTVAEVKKLTNQGITIKDNGSEISLRRDPQSLRLMRDSYQKMYDQALYAYKTGGDSGLGETIVSPYPYLPSDAPFGGGDRRGRWSW